MKRKITFGVFCAFSFILLFTGCTFSSGDDLYSLPQAPEDYLELQKEINRLRDAGLEYVAPLSGSHTQLVQMVDFSGNGTGDCVAFFRDVNSEKPLKIYIFRQVNETYEVACIIEGTGTAINRIDYVDMSGDGWLEIVVSWQMTTKVQSISVYSVKAYEAVQMVQTGYTQYAVCDINQDLASELVVFHCDTTGQTQNRADYYAYEQGELVQLFSAPMSEGISEISSIKAGYLADGKTALFVDSAIGDGVWVTDIFAMGEVFANLTLEESEQQQISMGTVRTYNASYSMDVDKDGIFEVSKPERLPVYQSTGSDNYWLMRWYQYSSEGTVIHTLDTYHNLSDGWFIILPESWISQFTVSRQDVVTGERTVVFSKWVDEDTEPVAFLKLYKLTGANREDRSQLGNRFVLYRDVSNTDTIYAAEFVGEDTEGFHLSEEALIERFHLIVAEWNRD